MMHHWDAYSKIFRHHCFMCPGCGRNQMLNSEFPDWDHSDCQEVSTAKLEALEFFQAVKGRPEPRDPFRIATYKGVPILKDTGITGSTIHKIVLFDDKYVVNSKWSQNPEK